MKKDIIISGVGGQGILSIAAVIGMAALENKLFMKQAEVHGMSQRGGDVQSNLRISSEPVFSDLIPKGKADMVLSIEPMEALRYAAYLSPEGWIVTNTAPVKNIPDYPSEDELKESLSQFKRVVMIDADAIAKDCGSSKSGNIVMLGAASPFLDIPFESFENGIRQIFGRKGEEVVEMNINALHKGRKFAEEVAAQLNLI